MIRSGFIQSFTRLCLVGLIPMLFQIGCSKSDKTRPGEVGGLPATISQQIKEGEPNPVTKAVTLTNSGECDLDFTVSVVTAIGAGWLSVTPTANTVKAGESIPLSVGFDVTGLRAGTYTGTITVSGSCARTGRTATGSPATISVNLTVTPLSAVIELSNTTVSQDVVTQTAATITPLVPTVPIGSCSGMTAVWTGFEMLIWGGIGEDDQTNDIWGRYSPETSTWAKISTKLAPTPRSGHTAVWTGSEMIVWGGMGTEALTTGASYNPDTDTWKPIFTIADQFARVGHTAIWTGTRMIVWGGRDKQDTLWNNGMVYNPGNDSWVPLVAAPIEARIEHTAVWNGSEMIIWGGKTKDGGPAAGGARYDPESGKWTLLNTHQAPSDRHSHSAVWTGKLMVIWGGIDDSGQHVNSGASYDPVRDSWSVLSLTDAPTAHSNHVSVWTGARMIVLTDDINYYDPETDSWTLLKNGGWSVFRSAAVWSGTELLVWGGESSSGLVKCVGGVWAH